MIKVRRSNYSHRVSPEIKKILDDKNKLCEAVYSYGGTAQFARAIGVSTPTLTYYYKKHGINGSGDARSIGSLSAGNNGGATQSILNESKSMIDFHNIGTGSWLPTLLIGCCIGASGYALVDWLVK